jgi:hypothetical protein
MKSKLVAAVFATMFLTSAQAWKPTMHAAIAEAARLDALDGYLTIPDLKSGPLKFKGLNKGYQVDPELVQALKKYPEHYRAGTMGPDAYPDILTGQMVIHPDAPSNTFGGTNIWLEHLWNESLKLPLGEKRLKVRAFAAGYLTHGAGDMFGHTFVNHYAGGDFDVLSTNFLRHLVFEGYIAKHAPGLESTSTSIDGIEDWIYSTLIDCRKGTYLADRLYKGETVIRSLPFLFSKLRDELQEDIENYERHKDDLRRAPAAPIVAYKREWIKDIDRGLKALVTLSHNVAQHLVLFDADNIDPVLKEKILNDKIEAYLNNHLISMLGAPDYVGLSRAQIGELTDAILYSYVSEEEIIRMKANLMDYLVGFTGMKYSELKDYLKRPEFHFDQVMSASRRPRSSTGGFLGQPISLSQINQKMGLTSPNSKFVIDQFAPAYNTLIMSKLILLSQAGAQDLLTDLGVLTNGTTLPKNFMLGFNRKFDGSIQWKANPEKMLLESAGVFDRVFKRQDGDDAVSTEKPMRVPKTYQVTVKVKSVKSLDALTDIGSAPDFYSVLRIGSEKKTFDALNNASTVSPSNWSFSKMVIGSDDPSLPDKVDIKISIFDEDGNLAGDDDHCDAAAGSNDRDISFTVDLKKKTFIRKFTGSIGTRTSKGSESDAVEVTFEVTVTPGS